jgi:hypothetical protein
VRGWRWRWRGVEVVREVGEGGRGGVVSEQLRTQTTQKQAYSTYIAHIGI